MFLVSDVDKARSLSVGACNELPIGIAYIKSKF